MLAKDRRGRKKIQDQDGDQADAKSPGRIDPERMERGRNDASEGEAAEAHPAHEVPSSTASEAAVEPMMNSRSWNQTIS